MYCRFVLIIYSFVLLGVFHFIATALQKIVVTIFFQYSFNEALEHKTKTPQSLAGPVL
jgi:hypothetical protein